MMDHSTTMLTQQQQHQHPQAQPEHASVTDQAALAQQSEGGIKRKQVKNACTNCQKACKKCDDDRPCQRCVKFGLSDTCASSVRKERKKGIKRGPYKRKGKHDEDEVGGKTSKGSTSDSGSNTGDQQHAPPPPPPMYAQVTTTNQQGQVSYAYGYPPNLNQYHFLPYQYPYYGGVDNKSPQAGAYPVNYGPPHPIYQYPVPYTGQQPPPPPAHAPEETVGQPDDDASTDTVKKQPSTETTSSDSQLKKKAKSEASSKDQAKPQPMTPVPSSSSSSSSGTMSPDSNQEDENVKHARLSQLCSAALKQDGSTTATTKD